MKPRLKVISSARRVASSISSTCGAAWPSSMRAHTSSTAPRYACTVAATYAGDLSRPSILKLAIPASVSGPMSPYAARSFGDRTYLMSPVSNGSPSTTRS